MSRHCAHEQFTKDRRSEIVTSAPMPSVFVVPDLKKTTSLRLPESVRLKVEAIRDFWKVVAEEERGASKEEVALIDNTFVMVTLMSRQADEELQQFGGFPTTAEQMAEQMKKLRAAIKSKKSTK